MKVGTVKESLLWVGATVQLVNDGSLDYYSYITAITEGQMVITEPVNVSGVRLPGIQSGVVLEFLVFIDEVLYSFHSTTVRIEERRLCMEIPEEMTKVQRRGFYRVAAQMKLIVRLGEQRGITASTNDISGGGMSFFCQEALAPPLLETVSGEVYLTNERRVDYRAKVVRIVPGHKMGQVKVGLEFVNLPEAVRKEIILNNYWISVNRKKN